MCKQHVSTAAGVLMVCARKHAPARDVGEPASNEVGDPMYIDTGEPYADLEELCMDTAGE